MSNRSLADGMPLVWAAELFDRLRHSAIRRPSQEKLRSASVEGLRKDGVNVIRLTAAWNISNLTPLLDLLASVEQNFCSVVLNIAEIRRIDSAFVGPRLLFEQSLVTGQLILRLTSTPNVIRSYLQIFNVQRLVVE
ncbi:MAG: hypothetical protein RL032_186 [Pseudomonadota bacterium]